MRGDEWAVETSRVAFGLFELDGDKGIAKSLSQIVEAFGRDERIAIESQPKDLETLGGTAPRNQVEIIRRNIDRPATRLACG